MTYRDDGDALLARLAALERDAAEYAATLAERDATIAAQAGRIAALEAKLAELRDELLEHAAREVDRARRHRPPPPTTDPIAGTATTPAEAADLYLAYGVERYRTGDREGATAAFQKGLSLVPHHPQLQRALRRYT